MARICFVVMPASTLSTLMVRFLEKLLVAQPVAAVRPWATIITYWGEENTFLEKARTRVAQTCFVGSRPFRFSFSCWQATYWIKNAATALCRSAAPVTDSQPPHPSRPG